MIKQIDCADCVELIVLSSSSDNESVNATVVENIEEILDEILKEADQPVDSLGERSGHCKARLFETTVYKR